MRKGSGETMGRQSKAHHHADQRADRGRDALTPTGSHRAVGKAGRRRVAAWPIACLVLVVLMVAGWFGWNWADGVMESRAAAQAADCTAGDALMRVAVDPALEEPVSTAATRWNRARTVVHDHCVHIDVNPATAQQVFDVLIDGADPATVGGTPAAWLPESSTWADRLSQQRPDLVGSSGQPVASGMEGDPTYLALGGADVNGVQERAAQSFRAFLLRPAQQAEFAAAGFDPAKD